MNYGPTSFFKVEWKNQLYNLLSLFSIMAMVSRRKLLFSLAFGINKRLKLMEINGVFFLFWACRAFKTHTQNQKRGILRFRNLLLNFDSLILWWTYLHQTLKRIRHWSIGTIMYILCRRPPLYCLPHFFSNFCQPHSPSVSPCTLFVAFFLWLNVRSCYI